MIDDLDKQLERIERRLKYEACPMFALRDVTILVNGINGLREKVEAVGRAVDRAKEHAGRLRAELDSLRQKVRE